MHTSSFITLSANPQRCVLRPGLIANSALRVSLGLIVALLTLLPQQVRAECSEDQERVYYEQTPYPMMTAFHQLTTFGTALASWAVPNDSGQNNPAWLLGYVFAGALGHFVGPSCEDISAAYIDGERIAEEKSALAPQSSEHKRMLWKFVGVYAANAVVLTGVYVDNSRPLVRTGIALAIMSPIIGYGLHVYRLVERRKEREVANHAHQTQFEWSLDGRVVPDGARGEPDGAQEIVPWLGLSLHY